MAIYSRFVKRPMDILLAILLLTFLSPVFVILILLYGFSFSPPIWYRQRRIGKDGSPFTLVKFRSLKNEAGLIVARRFALGDVVRFTSLDELPQLLHVLTGQMSLVGPRPLPIEYLPLFTAEQLVRHKVRPGITGWAQVNGRNSITWQKKFELDAYYVQHVSLALDMRILLKTIGILFSFRKDVSLTEEEFKG